MPNWCFIDLGIKGPKKDVQKLKETVYTNEEQSFDFNKIIPMPDDLLKGDEICRTWCIENWGCKWNASDIEIEIDEDELLFRFQTPNNPPIPIFKKLSEMFPTTSISTGSIVYDEIIREIYEKGQMVYSEPVEKLGDEKHFNKLIENKVRI